MRLADRGVLPHQLATVHWMAHEIGAEQVGVLGAVFSGMRHDPDLALGGRLEIVADFGGERLVIG